MKDKEFNCILFDLDGTLVDTQQLDAEILQQVLKKNLNKDYSKQELAEKTFGVPTVEAVKKFTTDNVEKIAEEWTEEFAKALDRIESFEGVEEVLDYLKERYILGIVTSRDREEMNQMLDELPFADFFQ